jgi:hypothetical protein
MGQRARARRLTRAALGTRGLHGKRLEQEADSVPGQNKQGLHRHRARGPKGLNTTEILHRSRTFRGFRIEPPKIQNIQKVEI